MIELKLTYHFFRWVIRCAGFLLSAWSQEGAQNVLFLAGFKTCYRDLTRDMLLTHLIEVRLILLALLGISKVKRVAS